MEEHQTRRAASEARPGVAQARPRRVARRAGGAAASDAGGTTAPRRRSRSKGRRRQENRGRWRVVWVAMWGDEKFRSLSDHGKLLWVYLLTGPEVTTLPGLVAAGRMHIAEALGWTPVQFDDAFAELSRRGMATADWDARLVHLPNAIRHNPPANQNMVVSYRGYWDELPECPLKIEGLRPIVAHLAGCSESHREAFLRAFEGVPVPLPERFAPPCDDGMPNQDQDQDQDQDHDQDQDRERERGARAREPESATPSGVSETGSEAGEAGETGGELAVVAEAILAKLRALPVLAPVATARVADELAEVALAANETLETLPRVLRAVEEGAAKEALGLAVVGGIATPPALLARFLGGCIQRGVLTASRSAAPEEPVAAPDDAARALDAYAAEYALSGRYGQYFEDPDGEDRREAGALFVRAAKVGAEVAERAGGDVEQLVDELLRHWARKFMFDGQFVPQRHRLRLIFGRLQAYKTPWIEKAEQQRKAAASSGDGRPPADVLTTIRAFVGRKEPGPGVVACEAGEEAPAARSGAA